MRLISLAVLVLTALTACTRLPSSFVDYASVEATPPPGEMLGVWRGPIGSGLLTFRITPTGRIASCIEDGAYRYAGEAKYTCGAINFEDGSRAGMRLSRNGDLILASPPGNQAAVLHPVTAGEAVWCR